MVVLKDPFGEGRHKLDSECLFSMVFALVKSKIACFPIYHALLLNVELNITKARVILFWKVPVSGDP